MTKAWLMLLELSFLVLVLTACVGEDEDKLPPPTAPIPSVSPSGPAAVPAATNKTDGEIWRPAPGISWQWQLTGDIDTTFEVDMYDVDLFDAPQEVIDQLRADGRVVICYFSAGSYEDWRSDADRFPDSVKGKDNGWPGELWLDIRQLEALQPIMESRLDSAAAKGCHGVEPDNVGGYNSDTGFPLTYQHQLNFNVWLADAAHRRGLSIGLKNDPGQIEDLLPHFDWSLNEECFQFDECQPYARFIAAGKAVFGVEYEGDPDEFCPRANSMNFDWLMKGLDLDAARVACR